MEEDMIVIRDLKTFCFDFDCAKYIDENLKHKIEFLIISNEFLAGNEINNEIEQFLLQYKHENSVHKHGKQQNQ